MHAVFLGTPAAAVGSLAALSDVIDISRVITQPDAPQGRSKRLVASPVKVAALEWGFAVSQPGTAQELGIVLDEVRPTVGVVVAYGRLLKPDVLGIPYRGFVNVHFSLLPRWRGAAPVERAILAGDDTTGVSLMSLDEGLDTGPVLARVETPIGPHETGGSLTARLAHLGAALVDDVLPAYLRGEVGGAPQIASGATHARRLNKGEAQLHGHISVDQCLRSVRAYNPRPGAWMMVAGERVKVHDAIVSAGSSESGQVTRSADGSAIFGCADGSVMLVTVQPPGKRSMSGEDWLRGVPGTPLTVEEQI
jgi:methionyl-tRNA formyltransferase